MYKFTILERGLHYLMITPRIPIILRACFGLGLKTVQGNFQLDFHRMTDEAESIRAVSYPFYRKEYSGHGPCKRLQIFLHFIVKI